MLLYCEIKKGKLTHQCVYTSFTELITDVVSFGGADKITVKTWRNEK